MDNQLLCIFHVEEAAKDFGSRVQRGLWDQVRRYKNRHVGRTKSHESCLCYRLEACG